jgi:hypothetical protein
MVPHDCGHAARADRILRLHDGLLLPHQSAAPALVPPAAARTWAAWTHEKEEAGRQHAALLVPGSPGPPPLVFLVQPCMHAPQQPTRAPRAA